MRRFLRDCLRFLVSSIFGIILTYFRFFFWGQYTNVDITPQKRIENRLKRTRKSTETKFADSLLYFFAAFAHFVKNCANPFLIDRS